VGSNPELYEQDFYAWTQTTAALIRVGKWDDLDREALAEEAESLGKSQYSDVALSAVWAPGPARNSLIGKLLLQVAVEAIFFLWANRLNLLKS